MKGEEKSVLSDKAIARKLGFQVVIEPFTPEHLNTSSYDVCLGENYFSEQKPAPGQAIYNPFDKEMVDRVWGKPKKAMSHKQYFKQTGIRLEGIGLHEKIIWLGPGETILAHTQEFIGGRRTVTAMMKARSSYGRNFIAVCKCAGWGDIGYTNRWTMEISNGSKHYTIPLIVGRRIAQIVFFDTEGTRGDSYVVKGKYQDSEDMKKVKATWTPEKMLPKMYKEKIPVATHMEIDL